MTLNIFADIIILFGTIYGFMLPVHKVMKTLSQWGGGTPEQKIALIEEFNFKTLVGQYCTIIGFLLHLIT